MPKNKLNSLKYFLVATSSLSMLASSDAYGAAAAAIAVNRLTRHENTQMSNMPGFTNGDNIVLTGQHNITINTPRTINNIASAGFVQL